MNENISAQNGAHTHTTEAVGDEVLVVAKKVEDLGEVAVQSEEEFFFAPEVRDSREDELV